MKMKPKIPSPNSARTAAMLFAASLTSLCLFGPRPAQAQAAIPKYDHVLIVIMENHAYGQITGSSSAPYINKLINDSNAALFTQSYGLSHPSEPNYVGLFCGSMHGIKDDNIPPGLPFTDLNLGAELLAKKVGYAAYSEDLPSTGSMVEDAGGYAQKHAPWCYWQGTGTNNLPASLHMPFKMFPTDYTAIPTVTFMVPNLTHDIHDGTISQGDTFIKSSFDGYIQWAKTHNSLFILTFDEDDESTNKNQVLTFFVGQYVKKGSYPEKINHYNILRTMEDMFSVGTHANAAATAAPITDVWLTTTMINTKSQRTGFLESGRLMANPVYGAGITMLSFSPVAFPGGALEILSPEGALIKREAVAQGQSSVAWNSGDRPNGAYIAVLHDGANSSSGSFRISK